MKLKKLKLTKKQIKETAHLKIACGAGMAAFEQASILLSQANDAFWRWTSENLPGLPLGEGKIKYNRTTDTFEYYDGGE